MREIITVVSEGTDAERYADLVQYFGPRIFVTEFNVPLPGGLSAWQVSVPLRADESGKP